MQETLNKLNVALINKYSSFGPRYTSYPTAPEWSDKFTSQEYITALRNLFGEPEKTPLALYIHFPYCPKRCFYCGCNNEITLDRGKINPVIESLGLEIRLLAETSKGTIRDFISEIHIGGGSPSYMDEEEFSKLKSSLEEIVDFNNLDEFSVELDPRSVNNNKLRHYAGNGVNRISLGVQDFDHKVQKAINRVQPIELLADLMTDENRSMFRSINYDLIYGLPHQTEDSFKETVSQVIKLRPTRIAIYNYAHMPRVKRHQAHIKQEDLPPAQVKTAIMLNTTETLVRYGYNYIGMDHFALPEDDMSKALENGTLHRNFMGYTAAKATDLIGIGPSSISGFKNIYAQNERETKRYQEIIADRHFATIRGLTLSDDDLIRREIINTIICSFRLDYSKIEKKYSINFQEYFRNDISKLEPFISDGLVTANETGLSVTLLGRLFARNICMAFDNYLGGDKDKQFSKTL